MPENLFQVQGKAQGSAGFLTKVAPLAWKLGKTRLSGRPAEGVIRFESFQKCLCTVQSSPGFHSFGRSIAVVEF